MAVRNHRRVRAGDLVCQSYGLRKKTMFGLPPLSLVIWVPILGGLAVLATGSDKNAPLARLLALIAAAAGFIVSIPLYAGFDVHTSAM